MKNLKIQIRVVIVLHMVVYTFLCKWYNDGPCAERSRNATSSAQRRDQTS